jgi:hypothetical protein
MDQSYPEICALVNGAFDVRDLVEFIGWHPKKLVRTGDIYVALCPIHRDTIFRTLVINPRNNTYHCKHGGCPGNAPADFIDLITRVRGTTIPEVIEAVIAHFGADYFRLTERQLVVVGRLADAARASREVRLPNAGG